jgi:hypothetical protein
MTTRRLAAVLAGTVILAGCGGGSSSSTVTPAAYVKSVCSAVGPFETGIQARIKALSLPANTSAAQGKQALETFLDATAADTHKTLDELKAAGTPSVGGGPKIASSIIDAFTSLGSALTDAAARARSLSTASPTAFRDGAAALGTLVRTSMGTIGVGLSQLRNPDLQAAAAKEPACTSIGS